MQSSPRRQRHPRARVHRPDLGWRSRRAIAGAVSAAVIVAAVVSVLWVRPTEARGPLVDADVLAALETSPTANVIIGWRPAGDPKRDPDRGGDALARLAGLPDGAVEVTARFQTTSSVAARVTAEGLAALAADPDVAGIALDPPLELHLEDSTAFMGASDLHRRARITGEGTIVAVLDTGTKSNHIDLRDAVIDEACFITPQSLCPSEPHVSEDIDGHGTAVAGIIASRGRQSHDGVAPDADIVSVKALEERNNAVGSALILAMEWVLERGDVDAVNLSLGSGAYAGYCDGASEYTRALAGVVDRLHDAGTVVVASSGNDGSSTRTGAPACVRKAVSVGAIQDYASGDPKLAQFTNRNDTLDILAPGVGVVAPSVRGQPQPFSGTSAAAPHISGAVALLRQAAPWASADLIVDLLKEHGQRPNLRYGQLTIQSVDVEAAYNELRRITPTATSDAPVTPTPTTSPTGPTATSTFSVPATATDPAPTNTPAVSETPTASATRTEAATEPSPTEPGPTPSPEPSETAGPTPAWRFIYVPSAENP